MFFKNIGGSNFPMQSLNSFHEVSKLEDYKVFLNPEKRKQLIESLQAFKK